MEWWAKYVGIPFVRRGTAGTGYDCWDLVREVYRAELEVELPAYGATLDGRPRDFAADHLAQVAADWESCEEEPFALALFHVPGGRLHVGLIVRPGLMLHTKAGADTCVEPWARTLGNVLMGFYRPRESTAERIRRLLPDYARLYGGA